MNGHASHDCCRTNRRPGGFTLIELMVAMLLGLIVIAGVSSVFLANLRSYHANTALGGVQSNARIAFELMARDIRQAGLTGCNSTGPRIANVLNVGTVNKGVDNAAWWANWANTVHGYSGATAADPAASTTDVAGAGKQVAGTDSLMLLGAFGPAYSVKIDSEPGDGATGAFTLNESSTDIAAGDVVIACDMYQAALFQVDKSVNAGAGGNAIIQHGTTGNCSTGLLFPAACPGGAYTFSTNAHLTKLAAHDWYLGYIGTNAADQHACGPGYPCSLYRVTLVNDGGVLKTEAQEMVRNVIGMQITYHVAGGATYEDASDVGVGNWGQVDAVRVKLTLQSAAQRAGTNAQPLQRSFTSTTTIRNRVM